MTDNASTDQEQTERGASTAEWVTLDDLEPGTLFEAESGTVAVKSEYHYPNCPPEPCQWECIIVGSGEMAHFRDKNQTTVRPIDLIQLRAALERVTAERDAMREVCEAAGMIAIREEYGTHRALRAALARLDATRKATADAAEEGKPE